LKWLEKELLIRGPSDWYKIISSAVLFITVALISWNWFHAEAAARFHWLVLTIPPTWVAAGFGAAVVLSRIQSKTYKVLINVAFIILLMLPAPAFISQLRIRPLQLSNDDVIPILVTSFILMTAGLVVVIAKRRKKGLFICILVLAGMDLWWIVYSRATALSPTMLFSHRDYAWLFNMYSVVILMGFIATANIVRLFILKLTGDFHTLQKLISLTVISSALILALWNWLQFEIMGGFNNVLLSLPYTFTVVAFGAVYVGLSFRFPKIHKLLVHGILIVLLMIPMPNLLSTATFTGWIIPITRRGEMLTTDDGLFEYRLDVINSGQRNTHFKLFVGNMQTNRTVFITINHHHFITPERMRNTSHIPVINPIATPTDRPGVYTIRFYTMSVAIPTRFGMRSVSTANAWIFEADFLTGRTYNPRQEHVSRLPLPWQEWYHLP